MAAEIGGAATAANSFGITEAEWFHVAIVGAARQQRPVEIAPMTNETNPMTPLFAQLATRAERLAIERYGQPPHTADQIVDAMTDALRQQFGGMAGGAGPILGVPIAEVRAMIRSAIPAAEIRLAE